MSHGYTRKRQRRLAAAARCIAEKYNHFEEKNGNFDLHKKEINKSFSVIVPKREVYHNITIKTLRNKCFQTFLT